MNFGIRRRLLRVWRTHLQPGSRTMLNGLDLHARTKIILPKFIDTVRWHFYICSLMLNLSCDNIDMGFWIAHKWGWWQASVVVAGESR